MAAARLATRKRRRDSIATDGRGIRVALGCLLVTDALGVVAASWGVLMALSPVLQIRRTLQRRAAQRRVPDRCRHDPHRIALPGRAGRRLTAAGRFFRFYRLGG